MESNRIIHSCTNFPSTGNQGRWNCDYVFLLTVNNPVFCTFMFWTSVLLLKMMMMTLLTAYKRFRNKAFPNQEDLRFRSAPEVTFGNPNVERARRAHRNDLENIIPHLVISILYIALDPNPLAAKVLFRLYALIRITHTFVYAFCAVPQPTRAITFFIGYGITVYMAFYILVVTFLSL
ncbi:MGST1 family protein [Megaselia abdita]